MDLRTRSLAIHSTIDFALISLSCSRGTSCLRYQKTSPRDGRGGSKTDILDPFHIVDIPPLVVLPTCANARSRKQARFVIIVSTCVVAVEEGGSVAPVGSTHATSAPTLQAIALSHFSLRRSSRRDGHGLEDFLIVQTEIGVRVEKLIFCIVT